MKIINEAKVSLKSRGIDQWQDGYPNLDTLKEDILNNRIYVLKNGEEVIGLFATFNYEPNYDYIEGNWNFDESYLAVHRVAIADEYKGQGKVKEIFDFVKGLSTYIRIDTHEDNHSMQKALKKNGFKLCGVIYLSSGAKRLAFDYHN